MCLSPGGTGIRVLPRFSIWAQLPVQHLDSPHLSDHRLDPFSQNLKGGGQGLDLVWRLSRWSQKDSNNLCPSWRSLYFGNMESCYATQDGLESMILLPQCPGCRGYSHVPPYVAWQAGLPKKERTMQDSMWVFWLVLREVPSHSLSFSTWQHLSTHSKSTARTAERHIRLEIACVILNHSQKSHIA